MSRTQEQIQADYLEFRGKCKEMSEALVAKDSTLTLVRGHYFCPIWNVEEGHWWCVKPDGTIVDPTAKQFPSNGLGIYTPFNGMVECCNCGDEVAEEKAINLNGYYMACSDRCARSFVGL